MDRTLPKSSLKRSLKHRKGTRDKTAFDHVKNLCGIIEDGPTDVSTNPKYMKDFGK
ncbi:MAG: hypothetical protein WCD79_10120 [Chthoniobacteraceae bacterium]